MRVLLVPEIYRADALACGTLRDAILWVEEWLRHNVPLHVYWLLPPRGEAGYTPGDVHADRDEVTLLEAAPLTRHMDGGPLLTDGGFSREELEIIREGIYEPGGYVDTVVDQRRAGQFALRQWLLALDGNPWGSPAWPHKLVRNVHDFQAPFKHEGCAHRGPKQMKLEIAGSAHADGVWFTAQEDERAFQEQARDALGPSLLKEVVEEARVIGSPLDLSSFHESYARRPRTLHLSGSFWEKKRTDRLLEIGERLHEEAGIRTLLTSMDPLPEDLPAPAWLEAHGEAPRSSYMQALDQGDLAIVASAYETMARTPFEQAASGQVLIARRASWIEGCVPEDYPFLGSLDALGDIALGVIDDWETAVRANRSLVRHVKATRSRERVGERTLNDLVRRATSKNGGPPDRDLASVVQAWAIGDQGVLLTEAEQMVEEDVARMRLVTTLRAAGYQDDGRSRCARFIPSGGHSQFHGRAASPS